MVNPIASRLAMEECSRIASLGLDAKVAVHVRCAMSDVQAAIECGAQSINVYMATSDALRNHSHGKSIERIVETAGEVLGYALQHGAEVRFSCEDAFRSDLEDILRVYKAVAALGVHRVGLADTVGIATPDQVRMVTERVRATVGPNIGINFHAHDDTGCCIANALVAVQSGATHIDTSILGIGERNGITPLGGFMARMYSLDPDYIRARFNLEMLGHLERYVASSVNVAIPFNNCITGSAAFTHKAGVHSKAVMASPGAYEILNPAHCS